MTRFTQKVKGQLHCGYLLIIDKVLESTFFTSCPWMDQDRGPPGPRVVHHSLFGLADIGLQLVAVAPRDEALHQSSVLCNSLSEDSVFLSGIKHVSVVTISISSKKIHRTAFY